MRFKSRDAILIGVMLSLIVSYIFVPPNANAQWFLFGALVASVFHYAALCLAIQYFNRVKPEEGRNG